MYRVLLAISMQAIGGSMILAEGSGATTGGNETLLPLGVVITIMGAAWYLSQRLTRIEDKLRNLPCQRCLPSAERKD